MSPASCARAPATAPPCGLLALIFSMHAITVSPAAQRAQAVRKLVLVGLQIGAADGFQLGQWSGDHFGVGKHLLEALRPQLEIRAGRGALAFAPVGQLFHSLGGGERGLLERGLILGRADTGKGLHPVAGEIFGVTAERAFGIIDERQRHRRADVGADLLRRGGDIAQEGDVGFEPRFRRRIRNDHVNRRVEVAGVIRRVGMRLVRGVDPEQRALRLRNEIVALELLCLRQFGRVEPGGCVDRAAQPLLLDGKRGLAPVRQFAVKFVAAGCHREGWIGLECLLDIAVHERLPFGRGGGLCLVGGRLLLCALPASAKRRNRYGRHHPSANPHIALLPNVVWPAA